MLWLLNHSTLRKFELGQLRQLGITEVYTPKRFPFDEANLSADVDYSLDATLSLTADELRLLNAQDWYGKVDSAAWELANRAFDVAIIAAFATQIDNVSRNFSGTIVLRAFGLENGSTYTKRLYRTLGPSGMRRLEALGQRFWFGAGYGHLAEVEGGLLRRRNNHLPVGLAGKADMSSWTGERRRILFVCPRIAVQPYYDAIYRDFVTTFGDLPYTMGGAQPLPVADPNVVGFLPRADHERNMHEHRVMFYHSTETNHLHYHPLEAVRVGMPLIFMAGGLLDRLGGLGLPGRAGSKAAARRKVQRILDGDTRFTEHVRQSQLRLFEAVSPEATGLVWRESFSRILAGRTAKLSAPSRAATPKKILVLLPIGYRGGSLRGALLLVQALLAGSRAAGQPATIVFAHLDDDEVYPSDEFDGLGAGIEQRPFVWRTMTADEAQRAMQFSGLTDWRPDSPEYQYPDDGAQQFADCDLWLVISDRLAKPILPLRPIVLMVYDYLQRYVAYLSHGADLPFLEAARTADRVLVTTEFTKRDALQYAGVSPERLVKVPMLVPAFPMQQRHADPKRQYFIWVTNSQVHKNHINAFKALRRYYEEHDGQLSCLVTGSGSKDLLTSKYSHLAPLRALIDESRKLRRNVRLMGDLEDRVYQRTLAGAAFLWHAAQIDNGTFSVVEAATLGVPSISTDYPAMREMDGTFGLGLSWMPFDRPDEMARGLKQMELDVEAGLRPAASAELIRQRSDIAAAGAAYWDVVSDLL